MWELRAAVRLSRLWHDQGRHTEARDLLAPVYGWFIEGFGTSQRHQGSYPDRGSKTPSELSE
jgi:predicted ATPase